MNVPWPKVRIDEVGHVQAGRQRSPSIVAGLMRPYLRVANVHDGYIDYHDVLEMPFSDAEFETFSLMLCFTLVLYDFDAIAHIFLISYWSY